MSDQPSPQSLRTEAIETLLIEKKLLTSEAIDTVLTTFSEQVGPDERRQVSGTRLG